MHTRTPSDEMVDNGHLDQCPVFAVGHHCTGEQTVNLFFFFVFVAVITVICYFVATTAAPAMANVVVP